MNNKHPLAIIKEWEMRVLVGVDLTSSQLDYLFSSLDSDDDDVVMAALLLLVESDLPVLERLMGVYFELPENVKRLTVSYLATTDNVECYVFLFNLIKLAPSLEEVNIAVHSLAYTHYFILPLIFTELNSDDDDYVKQLKRLIFMMGIDVIKPSLAILPQIPHEAVFRELFGGNVIDSIKNS